MGVVHPNMQTSMVDLIDYLVNKYIVEHLVQWCGVLVELLVLVVVGFCALAGFQTLNEFAAVSIESDET